MSTGFPQEDARSAFARERRRRGLARIAARLRHEPDDVSSMLPFEEVVQALGRRAEHDLGVMPIALDSIVGSVDRRVGEFDREFRPPSPQLRRRWGPAAGVMPIALASSVGSVDRRVGEFDREFRPASPQLRGRWERIAAARRRGEAMPPIEVFRIGELHFVADGHHRVSVARALGDTHIDANVREVRTKLGAGRELQLHDLPLKRHERVFRERIPLPPEHRDRIRYSDEWRYAQLAALIEAWGLRASYARERLLTREE